MLAVNDLCEDGDLYGEYRTEMKGKRMKEDTMIKVCENELSKVNHICEEMNDTRSLLQTYIQDLTSQIQIQTLQQESLEDTIQNLQYNISQEIHQYQTAITLKHSTRSDFLLQRAEVYQQLINQHIISFKHLEHKFEQEERTLMHLEDIHISLFKHSQANSYLSPAVFLTLGLNKLPSSTVSISRTQKAANSKLKDSTNYLSVTRISCLSRSFKHSRIRICKNHLDSS